MTTLLTTPRVAGALTVPPRTDLARLAENTLEKALKVQQPLARAHVARIRRDHPDATPAETVRALERHYLAGVTAMGAGSGAAAAVPGIGQTAGLALVLGEVPVFLDAMGESSRAAGRVRVVCRPPRVPAGSRPFCRRRAPYQAVRC